MTVRSEICAPEGASSDPSMLDGNAWPMEVNEHYFPIDSRPTSENFQGSLTGMMIGQLSLVRCSSDPILYSRTREHISKFREEYFLVTVPRHAKVTSTQSGKETDFSAGELFIERVHEPFRYLQNTPNTILTLGIPGICIYDYIQCANKACGTAFDVSQGIGKLLVDYMASALRHPEAISPKASDAIARHLRDLLVLLVNDEQNALLSGSSAVRSAHLRRVEQFVLRHKNESQLSPLQIAEGCNISLRYLHSLFFDTEFTVSEYIKEQRLMAANTLLKNSPTLKLAEVAYQCGFSDHATLSRQFRYRYGLAPSSYRKGQDIC